MKLAVSGKGGVGKTTFSALLIRTFDDLGNQTAPAPINDWPDEL